MYSGQQHYSSSTHLGATFSPGGMDDFSMPELVSPSPQRSAPEEFHEIQGKLQHMELGADTIRPTSVQSTAFSLADTRGGTPHSHAPTPPAGQGQYPDSRQNSIGGGYGATHHDAPSFSPFPKLSPRPPNVPPSDDEKLQILESAKAKVIASNDPEIQLTWAQDTLNFVEIAAQDETRNAVDAPRPSTPRLEHELKQEAVAIVSFLAEQFHPRAQFIKGMWLEFGKFGTRKDLRESYRCYARASERGYSRSEYRMGMQFEGSNDVQKAIQHYNIGVAAHDAASSYRIGMMTLLGQHGQAHSVERGLELIKYSADNADENSPQGAFIYGMLLARELPQITVPDYALHADQNLARTYIEKAAFLGFAKAQTKLGRAYEHSELGCHFDAVLSLHYNNLAARQGDEDAEMAISKWFLSGQEGVFAKNEQMAYLYAKRAAKSGLSTAEFAMGYFHEVGINVPVDLKEAQRWYRKAAESGNKDAAARVEGISRSKTLSRKDHEKVALQKVRNARAADQSQPPRGSSRAGGANGAPIAMPQPGGPNGSYPQAYPPANAAYTPASAAYPPAGATYPPAGATYPPAGAAYAQQPAHQPVHQPVHQQPVHQQPIPQQQPHPGASYPPGQYGAYQQGHPPAARPNPSPAPSGYGSPAPGQQHRPPYQAGQPPARGPGTPQMAPGAAQRRPVQTQTPVQTPPAADFGFQAPPDNYKPRPDYTQTGHYPTPSHRPDYPSNPGTPVAGVPAQRIPSNNIPKQAQAQRPVQQAKPQPQPQQKPPAARTPQPPQAQKPPPRQQQQAPPAKQNRPPARPMQQGPSTFDEMGVPGAKDKDNCAKFTASDDGA